MVKYFYLSEKMIIFNYTIKKTIKNKKMKKIAFLFLISFFAFSCTKEELIPEPVSVPPIIVTITSTTNVLVYGQSTGSITAKASGGIPPYTYTLGIIDDHGAIIAGSSFTQSSGIFLNLKTARYIVIVVDSSVNSLTSEVMQSRIII